jgi:hypothetical protein
MGNKVPILSVRCGKSEMTQVAEILSTALCDKGNIPEIFISRHGLGANQTTAASHARIYAIHLEFLNDVTYIPLPPIGNIDAKVTEYLENGETRFQSPRMWARSLTAADGSPLEIDLEKGTHDGNAVLIGPSASLAQAQVDVKQYLARLNPILSTAGRLYADSASSFPNIPKVVFTKTSIRS